MEIHLTYRGKIPSRKSDINAVWDMRRSFHQQLLKLRDKEPFALLDEEPYSLAGKEISGQRFAPFYGQHVKVQVSLDITLLTGMPPLKSVLTSGDLDNRLKRIVDALRMPGQKGEVVSQPITRDICYCLMDDDSAVSEISAKLGAFLASDDVMESFAFIRAKGTPSLVTMDNIAMLF